METIKNMFVRSDQLLTRKNTISYHKNIVKIHFHWIRREWLRFHFFPHVYKNHVSTFKHKICKMNWWYLSLPTKFSPALDRSIGSIAMR